MLTLAQLAEQLDGVWHGNANHAIFSLASLTCATATDIAYFDNPLLKSFLDSTHAGAVLLKEEHRHLYFGNSIVVSNPLQAMMHLQSCLPVAITSAEPQIAPSAQIHSRAQLAPGVSIGANCVIGAEARLAVGVRLGANTVIEAAVTIGEYSVLANNVVVHAGCHLGSQVVLNSGCVIGASPFNYVKEQGHWRQGVVAGSVFLADRVHVGANTVIDRGTVSDTYLAEGVCIDNLVQIAHDVFIGKHALIAGCVAVGAYARIGADCIIGGASSIAADVHLVDDVVITGRSTVNKSLSKSGIYSSGTLIHEHRRWRRNAARFKRLDDYINKLTLLEKKLDSVDILPD